MNVVTGATGHVGNTLVRMLCSRGDRVRCFVLPGEDLSPLDGLDIEVVRGDVRDLTSLVDAFAGADTVYHLASVISLIPGQEKLLRDVNVGGVRSVIAACRATAVRRLVYCSSIHAIVEPPHGTLIDEGTPIDPTRIPAAYGKSKAEATLAVLAAARDGLNAVIVCPTGIIGPNDFKGSEMGRMFISFARGRMPAYVEGAYDFVDVRDVATGLMAAAERGRCGQVYILSGELIHVKQIMETLALVTGVRAPRFCVPSWLADMAAVVTTATSRWSHSRPVFTRDSLTYLRSNALTTHAKAERELGWHPRSVRQSIADTAEWLRQRGLIRLSPPSANLGKSSG